MSTGLGNPRAPEGVRRATELLEELPDRVARRYLRKIPPDPITERADSWVVVAPPAPDQGAVYDVKSGAIGTTNDGRPYGAL